ncbi:MAG: hypothetical protein JWL77_6157 [Chthonomonadaceae bacterium]|nr:hypothetical protein [Chthonomonadaceae bacterium]
MTEENSTDRSDVVSAEESDDANMTRKGKTYAGLLLLLLLLLPLGITVAKTYRDGRQQKLDSALFDALKHKNPALVKSRLAEGADPNARDIPSDIALDTRSVWWRLWDRLSGKPLSTAKEPTALLTAISKNEKGQFPPENIALVNSRDVGDYTPLLFAQMNGNKQIVNILKHAGATE